MSTAEAVSRRPTPRRRKGTIVGMELPDRMSSIGTFVLKNSQGQEVCILCDYRYTTEALIGCFGEVCVIGKKIWYRVDVSGVLATIWPAEDE